MTTLTGIVTTRLAATGRAKPQNKSDDVIQNLRFEGFFRGGAEQIGQKLLKKNNIKYMTQTDTPKLSDIHV